MACKVAEVDILQVKSDLGYNKSVFKIHVYRLNVYPVFNLGKLLNPNPNTKANQHITGYLYLCAKALRVSYTVC